MRHLIVAAGEPAGSPRRTALLVSGGGRYLDPWHPFAETSAALAGVMSRVGLDVVVDDDPDTAFAGLAETDTPPDLLVVNIGNPRPSVPGADAAEGIEAHLAAGRPLLAVHSSSTAFTEWARWREILGGRWIRGETFHPPQGEGTVRLAGDHPITDGAGVSSVTVVDEFYTALMVDDVDVIGWHEHEGVEHPVAWSHRSGDARVVYDALGHDGAAFASRARHALLRAELAWLLTR